MQVVQARELHDDSRVYLSGSGDREWDGQLWGGTITPGEW